MAMKLIFQQAKKMKFCCSLSIAVVAMLLSSTHLYALPIAGTSSGIFTNPAGPSGMIVSGVGTSHFTWGDGSPFGSPPSSLNFTGASFNTETEQVFSFGTLSYFNGTIMAGTEANSVELNVTISLTTPSGINQDFDYTFELINTPNTSDPVASADFVKFQNVFPTSSFTVGSVNYTLELLGVGSISGGGFSTIGQFHVFEGQSASGELLGRITANFPGNTLPIPSTMILFGIGLASLGWLNYISNRKRA